MPGCKSLGCPAEIFAAVGAIWEASKIGGLNIKKCLQPRELTRGKIAFADTRVALLDFGFWRRSRSLRRLLPAPAATGILPTLSLQVCHRMPGLLPRRLPDGGNANIRQRDSGHLVVPTTGAGLA